jgi:hypothetical protein
MSSHTATFGAIGPTSAESLMQINPLRAATVILGGSIKRYQIPPQSRGAPQ